MLLAIWEATLSLKTWDYKTKEALMYVPEGEVFISD